MVRAANEVSGRRRRADATRNIESILEAAARVLAANPRASMQDVAEAAGVHRATVHRHFAAREDLLRAVEVMVLDEVLAVLERFATVDGGGKVLEAATRAAIERGDRYRLYRVTPSFGDVSDDRVEGFRAALGRLLQKAQRDGSVRKDLPLRALVAAWGGLVLVSLPGVARGDATVDEAASFVLTLLRPAA